MTWVTHIFRIILQKIQLYKKYMPLISLLWQEIGYRLIDSDQCAKTRNVCKKLLLVLKFCANVWFWSLFSVKKYYMNKKYYYYWGYKSILLCREFWPIWWQHYLGPRIPSCLSKEWINFSNLSWVKISGCTVVEFKRSGVPTISKQIK